MTMSNILQNISMKINNLYNIWNKTVIKKTNNLDIVQTPNMWFMWFALWTTFKIMINVVYLWTTFKIRSPVSIGSSRRIDWLIAKHLKHGKHHANKHMFPLQRNRKQTGWCSKSVLPLSQNYHLFYHIQFGNDKSTFCFTVVLCTWIFPTISSYQVDSRHLLLCHLIVHIVCLMVFLTWLWYSSYNLSKMFSHNWQELGRLSSKKVVLAMVLFKERKQRVPKTLII